MTRLLKEISSLDGKAIAALAHEANVPYNTLLNIRKGVTRDPRISTVESLLSALDRMRESA